MTNEETLIATLYRTLEEEGESAAGRVIYSTLFGLRRQEEYDLCDRLLLVTDVNRLTPPLMIAILTVTASMKKWLHQRTAFYMRTKAVISNKHGPEFAAKTLIGLD